MKKLLIILALLTALVLITCSAVSEKYDLLSLVAEHTESEVPESAAALVQKDLYRTTINNVEITIREAAYDGRSLFLQYGFRMTDVDHPLAITAAEAYGDELPEDMDPDEYVYSLTDDAEDLLFEHNVGWWIDDIWFDGRGMSDMPDGSGQFFTGTDVPGELLYTDIWRLDNLDIFLEGKVQVSLPIGERQDYTEFSYYDHPEKYTDDGLLTMPDKGMVTFELDTKDILSSVRVFRPEEETVLPDVTVTVRDAAFSPMMTYIKLDLDVQPDAMDAFIAENGEYLADDDGEPIWYYGPMDVFGEWIDSLMLTDGSGTVLFPDNYGPAACSDEEAEFLCPYLEKIPDALYLAPVDDDGIADLSLAVPILPAHP